MAVILSEVKIVFENHTLAQCAAVSKQTSKRKAAGMTAMHLSLQCHSSVICCSGASVVSPETATAAQTLLQCHDNPVSTGHARRRSEAVANLEPYVDRMANQYNKSSNVHWFEVGQHVGLKIPSEVREKMDPRFVVCMVISKQRLDGYKLRCEHGVVQGVIRTDQVVSWKSEHSFPFTASDDVSQLKQLSIPAVARLCTKANGVPARCSCKKGCKTGSCTCRKANVQCTARFFVGRKCDDWGEH